MNIRAASSKVARRSRKHGKVFTYTADQVNAINDGFLTIDDCKPTLYKKPAKQNGKKLQSSNLTAAEMRAKLDYENWQLQQSVNASFKQ
tara:strand:- start:510 stop:776 length:267 start_codon:yes stop_codon:yes gene_type:complete